MTKEEDIIKTLQNIKETNGDSLIVEKFEEPILKLKNLELSYFFAKYIKGANIKAHEKVILESKDSFWNYKFAHDVKGANIKAHGKAVIESKDPKLNYYFARDIKGADIVKHKNVILESGDNYYIHQFNFNINYFDENEVMKKILSLNTNNVDNED